MSRLFVCGGAAFILLLAIGQILAADKPEPIPHAQDKPPGPALSPDEAIRKMTVPEGFKVELVASEPDIVNPVAMTFDERGRVWITESLEYPRREAGPGRDRIKILEDTDGDGRMDKFTIFAEWLNIPSGIAVGYGGVWVANSPDILFLQDTDGDGRADKQEVVVTGFGRSDTHELPNSLTWGPDGWLYGLNGVFNPCHVKHQGKEHNFTCALFRIHPRTREFQLFAEGTSNPWGVAWNEDGEAFLSACVIDHLWHLTERGYYHRQGGPYPPFTWKLESIVGHKHQKAAYCGIHYFDSDAYPAEYRGRLYMGNIHGGCINVDSLETDGATYKGIAHDDFLIANDAWFMPVVQKTGPDGCLWVLDWYDRYHCYQDANRDPAGIDRLKGRLYRVRYKDSPRAGQFNLTKETDDQLLKRLASPNVYFRDIAQRLLTERNTPATRPKLEQLVMDAAAERKNRLHALWVLVGQGKLDEKFHLTLLAHEDSVFRAWGVRAAGNSAQGIPFHVLDHLGSMARDPAPQVRVQVAIAWPKLYREPLPELVEVLVHGNNDKIIPAIVWQNLHPLLETQSLSLVGLIRDLPPEQFEKIEPLLPRVAERILGRRDPDPAPIVALFALLSSDKVKDSTAAQKCLAVLSGKIQSREISVPALAELRDQLSPPINKILHGKTDHPLHFDSAILATSWKDPAALAAVRGAFASPKVEASRRLQALDALVAAGDDSAIDAVGAILANPEDNPQQFRAAVLPALGRVDDDHVAQVVLANYSAMEPELQPKAIVLLTQRSNWSKLLLEAISQKKIPASVLGVNEVRKLLSSGDAELVKLVRAKWGDVRTDRNPQREQVIADVRALLRREPGDAHRGEAVFKKVCAQCHKLYGEGQEVGPDITANGRGSYEQLLSNVLDPSLVIGASYQARIVVTDDGRVLTGLVLEESDQRIVLKIQGGKTETIARGNIEQVKVSNLSMMPEELEKQLKPQELADLFAFLTLDKHPSDPAARQLPGVREINARTAKGPEEFDAILREVAPGFSTTAVGDGGLRLLKEHRGRPLVVQTHPISEQTPCVLRRTVDVPAGKRTRLVAEVSHDPRGDWRLVIKAGGKQLYDEIIGPNTTKDGWTAVSVDLTPWAGKSVDLELQNAANNWAWELAFWGRVEIVSE